MNIQEQLALIEALKNAGATHYKSTDFEITLEVGTGIPTPAASKPEVPAQNDEATEKLKDLIGTLQMNDEELLNKIMPNGAGG